MHSPSDLAADAAPRRPRSPWEIGKFRKEARLLLYQAIYLILAVRIALWFLPSRLVFRYAARWVEHARAHPAPLRPPTTFHVAWAVRVVGRRIPGASCLTQALAGQILMAWYGHVSEVSIGVARDGTGELIAHAWLETSGMVLIGKENLERYTRLPDISIAMRQFGRSL